MSEFLAWIVMYLIFAFLAMPALIGEHSYRKSVITGFYVQGILAVIGLILIIVGTALETLTK